MQAIQYVIYKRVSTKKQGESGLGLEAQDRDIQIFLETYSDVPYEVIGEFLDIESGSNSERPELKKALSLAKSKKATLLVSKLDRLSRRVSKIAELMEDKQLNFKVACMPHADAFQLHIYAALAQQEREFISIRTKTALEAAKERGVKLGGLRDKTNARNKAKKAKANSHAEKLREIVIPLREQGKSLRAIADALNMAGFQTPQGKHYQAPQVSRILNRLGC